MTTPNLDGWIDHDGGGCPVEAYRIPLEAEWGDIGNLYNYVFKAGEYVCWPEIKRYRPLVPKYLLDQANARIKELERELRDLKHPF